MLEIPGKGFIYIFRGKGKGIGRRSGYIRVGKGWGGVASQQNVTGTRSHIWLKRSSHSKPAFLSDHDVQRVELVELEQLLH